ncbi:hypothetical protein WME89_18250 [Sorangium sp. So ce321]|uniref:hypothetical protein n=1 Tax=Sorangium sp. So ce321 TaxID=3133300 RepID=UPI003F5EBD88
MRTTSLIVPCVLLMVGCSGPGSGGSASGEAGGGSPGVTSGSGNIGGSGGDPTGSGGDPTGSGGDPTGSGGDPTGSGGDPTGSGGDPTGSGSGGDPSGSGGDPSGSGSGGSGGDPSGSGGDPSGSGGDSSGSGGDPTGSGGSGGSGGGTAALFPPCGTPGTWRDSPEAFLDLGHTRVIRRIRVSGDRVVSWDHDRWILWDTATRSAIADGHAPGGFDEGYHPPGTRPELPGGVELRGDLLLVQTDPMHTFELRNAADGSLVAAISGLYGIAGLASDGSYAWATRSGGIITVWSRAGDEVLSATLEVYGEVHAAPDALRIASRSTATPGVQVVPIDGSPPSITPAFAGTFHAWSQDGARFLTTTGNTVRVYSKTGVQESIVNLPEIDELAATGDYLWTHSTSSFPGYPLKIYRIGGGNVPVARYESNGGATVVPTERAIGVFTSDSPKLAVVDLGGSEVTRTEHAVAVHDLTVAHIDGGLRWAVGSSPGAISQKGTVTDPDATGTLGCGASNLGGSASGKVAIATAAGTILLYDTADLDAGPTASVPLNSARVRLSADGRVLAARATESDTYVDYKDLRIFSLPDGAEVASLDSDFPLLDFSLSSSGTTLGRTYKDSTVARGGTRIVSDVSGETVVYQDTGLQPVPVISPDGRHFLLTDEATATGCGFTQFYVNGVLVNAVPGCAVGWLDDTHALVQTYTDDDWNNRWEYRASTIYDELGNPIATPPLPRITLAPWNETAIGDGLVYGIVPVSPTAIHALYEHAIYDVETGATLATLPEASVLAGSSVVYACGNAICAAPY